MLPTPPTTTTMSEVIRKTSPMPGLSEMYGAANVPARPASALPTLTTIRLTRLASMPMMAAVSMS